MKYIFYSLCLIALNACNSDHKVSKAEFDNLDKIFSSANWKVISGTDTLYWYFSRMGDTNFDVYQYKMIDGDSSLIQVSKISQNDNAINWFQQSDTLHLSYCDSISAKWTSVKNRKMGFEYRKIAEDSLEAFFPDERKALFIKTLPLATFLVRSRYDHLNNTHTVDSPIVLPRDKSLQ